MIKHLIKRHFASVAVILSVILFTPLMVAQQHRPVRPVKKPQKVLLTSKKQIPKIKNVQILYDDCQMILYLKGESFGTVHAKRQIRLKSNTQMYTPQILRWTNNQIDCLLNGNFELGRYYDIYMYIPSTNTIPSNKYKLLINTRLSLPNHGYKPGQEIAVGGCLLGNSQGTRKLYIDKKPVVVTQWCCEDIVFRVPNLRPGVYSLHLGEGRRIISNKLSIRIIRPGILPNKIMKKK